MKIDFNTISEKEIPAFKGGEKFFAVKMFDDATGKIMHGRLIPGASIGMHTHTGNSEVIFILSGKGYSICNGEKEILSAGECSYCKEGGSHCLVNDGTEDLIFFAVVPVLQ